MGGLMRGLEKRVFSSSKVKALSLMTLFSFLFVPSLPLADADNYTNSGVGDFGATFGDIFPSISDGFSTLPPISISGYSFNNDSQTQIIPDLRDPVPSWINSSPDACNAHFGTLYPGLNVSSALEVPSFQQAMNQIQMEVINQGLDPSQPNYDLLFIKILQSHVAKFLPSGPQPFNESEYMFWQSLSLENKYLFSSHHEFQTECGSNTDYFMELLSYFGYDDAYGITFWPNETNLPDVAHTIALVNITHNNESILAAFDPLYNTYLSGTLSDNPVDYIETYKKLRRSKDRQMTPQVWVEMQENDYLFGPRKVFIDSNTLDFEIHFLATEIFGTSNVSSYDFYEQAYHYVREQACVHQNPALTAVIDQYDCQAMYSHNWSEAVTCSYNPQKLVELSYLNFKAWIGETCPDCISVDFLAEISAQGYPSSGDIYEDFMFFLTMGPQIYSGPTQSKIDSLQNRIDLIDSVLSSPNASLLYHSLD